MSNVWGDVERKEGKDFEPFEIPPDGAIPARICAMVDVGTHDARDLNGGAYERRCLILGFELGEQDSKGNPFFMSKLITLSMHTKAALYGYVKALHGEVAVGDKFQPGWLAGKACLLQISHTTKSKNGKDRTYANLDSVGRPPKGFATPQGGCAVWRAQDWATVPMPDLGFLPPIWNEVTGTMMTVAEWAEASKEVQGTPAEPSTAGDRRLPAEGTVTGNGGRPLGPAPRSSRAAAPMTQAEADEVPF